MNDQGLTDRWVVRRAHGLERELLCIDCGWTHPCHDPDDIDSAVDQYLNHECQERRNP
jgi:hypothetical protein